MATLRLDERVTEAVPANTVMHQADAAAAANRLSRARTQEACNKARGCDHAGDDCKVLWPVAHVLLAVCNHSMTWLVHIERDTYP